MEASAHQMLIQMSQKDYGDTLVMIDQITKRREESRRKMGLSTEPRKRRKTPPKLKIVLQTDDSLTISLSERDYGELMNIFKSINNSRERCRKYEQKKRGFKDGTVHKMPSINIVK